MTDTVTSKVRVEWVRDTFMVGSDSKGASVAIGADKDGAMRGQKASDMLLLAAAACSLYDIVTILTKQRFSFRHVTVICTGDQLSEPPYTFTKIHLHYKVEGDVPSDKLERAITLSEDKYCSVISTLRSGVEITNDYEIL